MEKPKKKDKRGLFRVSWVESTYAWRVRRGLEDVRRLKMDSSNTKAATYRGAIKNIKKTQKVNWDLLSIAKIEKYDYENKVWVPVYELGPDKSNYRDYPASGTFQELIR